MRIFMDWEFVERGPAIPIQPVSCGLVADDGRELYLINLECLTNVYRHPWLSVNVLPSLPIKVDIGGPNAVYEWDKMHEDYQYIVPLDTMADLVREFVQETEDPQLWAYYGAYDHVVYAQLFGTMAELPAGLPMFTHELQQEIERRPHVELPAQASVPHHALWDARWNQAAYAALFPLSAASIEFVPPSNDFGLSGSVLVTELLEEKGGGSL